MALISDDCVELITGSPRTDTEWEAAVVLQGPYERGYIQIIIEEWHKRSPNALLIVSTYLPPNEDVLGFLSPYERKCIDAGFLIFVFVKTPCRERWPEFWRTNFSNQNLQRLTSFAGLRHARALGIPFALKIRADTFLGRRGVIQYMRDSVESKHPLASVSPNEMMKGRLVVTGSCTITCSGVLPNAPFHIRDHYYFGYTDDLLLFFDMTDLATWNNGSGIALNPPESAMTELWMRRIGITMKITGGIRELLGRYFIVEDPHTVEQARISPRGPGGTWWSFNYSQYLREGAEYVRDVFRRADNPALTTTHTQWEEMLITH